MNTIIEILTGFYLYDLQVFSNPWMYIPFCIPILFYIMFFVAKWVILTLPIWCPIMLITGKIKIN